MPARSLTPIGPVPDTGQGMGLDMVPAIGDIRSGIMAVHTDRSVLVGMVDMVASARRVRHQVCLDLARLLRLMCHRNSGRNCELGSLIRVLPSVFRRRAPVTKCVESRCGFPEEPGA